MRMNSFVIDNQPTKLGMCNRNVLMFGAYREMIRRVPEFRCGSGVKLLLSRQINRGYLDGIGDTTDKGELDPLLTPLLYYTMFHSTLINHIYSTVFVATRTRLPISKLTLSRMVNFKDTSDPLQYLNDVYMSLQADYNSFKGKLEYKDFIDAKNNSGFPSLDIDTTPQIVRFLQKVISSLQSTCGSFRKHHRNYYASIAGVLYFLNIIGANLWDKHYADDRNNTGEMYKGKMHEQYFNREYLCISDATLLLIAEPTPELIQSISEPETYGISIMGERYLSGYSSAIIGRTTVDITKTVELARTT